LAIVSWSWWAEERQEKTRERETLSREIRERVCGGGVTVWPLFHGVGVRSPSWLAVGSRVRLALLRLGSLQMCKCGAHASAPHRVCVVAHALETKYAEILRIDTTQSSLNEEGGRAP